MTHWYENMQTFYFSDTKTPTVYQLAAETQQLI